MCGIFIPDRVQASQSGANRKVSNRLGVGGIPHIPTPAILLRPAYEDGTDRGFRNVGY